MKEYFSLVFNKNRLKLIIYDQMLLFFSIFLSYFIRYSVFYKRQISSVVVQKILFVYIILSPLVMLFFYVFGVYEKWEIGNFSKTVVKILFSSIIVSLFVGFVLFFIPTYFIGRLVFVFIFPMFFILLIFQRFVFFYTTEKKPEKRVVYLIGIRNDIRDKIKEELSEKIFDLKFVKENEIAEFIKGVENNPLKNEVIVLDINNKTIKSYIEDIIKLKFKGYYIYDIETFFMSITGKILNINFENVWRIIYEKMYLTNISSYYNLKRVFDIISSLFLLIAFSPVFLIVSVLIKLTSRGPVFFIQERLGWYKKPFKLIKFRTMIVNAEEKTGPKWAEDKDPRITKIGRFLRFTRLDELPQLINVLKGDMSMIGNRPIREYFADILKKEIPFYDLRFFIKPGLTGWSQVKLGYINSVEAQKEKFQYELFYIKNMSILFDLIILIKTIKTVLNLKGR